jgi:hypothetical protein
MKYSLRSLMLVLTPKRSWFQFSLRTLLSLPLLFAVGWWWVTWPGRTAERYRKAMIEGTPQEARSFLSSPRVYEFGPNMLFLEDDFRNALRDRVTPHPRSVTDLLLSRQYFEVPGLYSEVKGFTVSHGKVVAVHGFDVWLAPGPEFKLSREAAAKKRFKQELQELEESGEPAP